MQWTNWIQRIYIATALAALGAPAYARIISVDDDQHADFNTIQAAIDDANDGDIVVVQPGTYTGPGNYDLSFDEKAITVRSTSGPEATIVDGAQTGHGFYIVDNARGPARLEGFTIRNTIHGAVKCYSSCPPRAVRPKISVTSTADDFAPILVSDCIIENNVDSGVLMDGHENVTVANCTIARNGDAGMWCYKSYPTIRNCTVAQNKGHGIRLTSGQLINCTIADNASVGFWAYRATVTNSIIWGNGLHQLYYPGGDLSVTYSAIQGGLPGTGNLDANPCFGDPKNGDYHLKSQAGRWNPLTTQWQQDYATSPCIDAGDPFSPIGPESFSNGGRVNVGAYGGTAEASKSYFGAPPCTTIIAGDINGDCRVDFADFRIMALHWLEQASTNVASLPKAE
jgi:parallel beta-helix repeat protein